VGFAEADEGGGGDRRVVEADHPTEPERGLSILAGRQRFVARLEVGERILTREPTRTGRTGGTGAVGRWRGVVHRADDTRLGAMCGRFTQQRPASELAEIFAAEPLADDPGARFNVAPTDDALVVVQREERRAITAYRWGLIPHWAADLKTGSRMFNARAETITTSPAFRSAFHRRRCLVPVDSFYEWKREGKVRQPFNIERTDGRPLVLAGLWAGWKDPDTETVRRTFTIVTTSPNEAVAELHDRMPVILPDDRWERWLDPSPADPSELIGLLQPTDEVALRIYAVNRDVNDVRRDGPELIEPLIAGPPPETLGI
jgi:putative SOS response-associated peptidase YedK